MITLHERYHHRAPATAKTLMLDTLAIAWSGTAAPGAPEAHALLADEGGALVALETLVVAGLEAIRTSLANGTPSDLEQSRAREIRINAREAAERRSLGRTGAVSVERVASTELLDALENVGNHIYRASEALSAEAVCFVTSCSRSGLTGLSPGLAPGGRGLIFGCINWEKVGSGKSNYPRTGRRAARPPASTPAAG